MRIRWNFITARSPHQGELWEAAVKAGKSILLRAIGNKVLTREELTTVLAKVEAILNSRPLCPVKSNEGYEPLTPAHFLIRQPLNDIPLEETSNNYLSRQYELQQSIIKGFWKRWVFPYLNQLQSRTRWKTGYRNLKVDDLVLIQSNSSVLYWLMGRVTEVYPDSNSNVRTISVTTLAGQVFKRSVQQLVLLSTKDSKGSTSADGEGALLNICSIQVICCMHSLV